MTSMPARRKADEADDRPSAAPLAYSTDDVAQMLGVSERHVRRQITTGKLKAVKLGGRVLILSRDLERYLESLPPA